MTEEEKEIFEKWFEEKKEKCEVYGNGDDFYVDDEIKKFCLMGYEIGLKAGSPQWHKITNWEDNSQFPKDEFKTYLVRLYQDHYVICGKIETTDGYRQFYIADNLKTVDPQEVVEWCEIEPFKE